MAVLCGTRVSPILPSHQDLTQCQIEMEEWESSFSDTVDYVVHHVPRLVYGRRDGLDAVHTSKNRRMKEMKRITREGPTTNNI